jgi:hypothetical protein
MTAARTPAGAFWGGAVTALADVGDRDVHEIKKHDPIKTSTALFIKFFIWTPLTFYDGLREPPDYRLS